MAEDNYSEYAIGTSSILVPDRYIREQEPNRVTKAAEKQGRSTLGVWGVIPVSVAPGHPEASELHNIGRLETVTEAFVELAALRSMKIVGPYEVVSTTGASAIDAHARGEYVGAHRVPATLTVRGLDLPDTAWHLPLEFRQQLWVPFKATDRLEKASNYGDFLFETLGGVSAFGRAARMIVFEQPTGKPVNVNLVNHVSSLVKRDFISAMECAIETVKNKQEVAYSQVIRNRKPGSSQFQALAEAMSRTESNARKPSTSYIAVTEYLTKGLAATKRGAAHFWTNPTTIRAYESVLHHVATHDIDSPNRSLAR